MTGADAARKGGKLAEGLAHAFNVYGAKEGDELLAALRFVLDCGADPELRAAFDGAAADAVARSAARPRPAPQPGPAAPPVAASPQQLLAIKLREAAANNPALAAMLAQRAQQPPQPQPQPQQLSFMERARLVKQETEMQLAALKQVFEK